MVSILLKKYKELGKDASKWKLKKRIFLNRMGYNLNKLLIFNWILGYLNMKGHKNWSFSILVNVILFLKKYSKKNPKNLLNNLLNKLKQNILLFNKKKGTLVFELPRFLTIEQSIKKLIEWIIKIARKSKQNIIKSFSKELQNVFLKKGEIFKKKKYITDTINQNKPFFYLLKKKKK
mgnify:FL=1